MPPLQAAGLGRTISVTASACALAFATVAATACGLTGPADPERSVVGTYRGQWHFGIHDPDTIGRGISAGSYHGFIACPGFLDITRQDGKDIRGSFGLSADGITSCISQQPGFCSQERVAAFCREMSGTLEGEAFSTGSPTAETILYEFRVRMAGQGGRAALSRLTGCNVVGAVEEWFSGGVTHDVTASAFIDVTAECGGYADLQRVDISMRLDAARVGQ
jgi:hypothetical protein